MTKLEKVIKIYKKSKNIILDAKHDWEPVTHGVSIAYYSYSGVYVAASKEAAKKLTELFNEQFDKEEYVSCHCSGLIVEVRCIMGWDERELVYKLKDTR